jgi:fructose-1-phosphate kinase PfkB-like protein
VFHFVLKPLKTGIHLNFAAVAATQCPLLLLDAFTTVVVKGPVPPKDSALRAAVDKIRAVRFAGPEVVFDTSGAVFDKFMIESANDYKSFLDEIQSMVDKK